MLRLLKNTIKTLKLVVCKQCLYLLLFIVKHIAIHVMLIVAWRETKLYAAGARTTLVQCNPGILGNTGTCHCKNNSYIVLRPKRRNNGEREKRLSTLYLELLIILDFGLFW